MLEVSLVLSYVLAFWLAVWGVIVASALWLLIGFVAVGIAHVLLPSSFIERNLNKPGFGSVLKASLFGIPLPLCSCSVIPVGVWLRNKGASRGATASFFISTPEIGVDSFLISYGLLGKFIAFLRLFTALVTAVIAGVLIDRFKLPRGDKKPATQGGSGEDRNACCSKSDTDDPPPAARLSFSTAVRRIFRFGFIDIVDDLAVLLSVGFLLAGVVSVLIPDQFFSSLMISKYLMILLMLGASMPFYVCATSSTPIAAALLIKGMNPGAVLVFLFAGPATNFATMLILSKTLGQRAFIIYVATVSIISVGIACGVELAIDYEMISASLLALPSGMTDGHGWHGTNSFLNQFAAVVLISLLSWRLIEISKKEKRSKKASSKDDSNDSTTKEE